MVAERAHEAFINSSNLATSTMASTQKSMTKPDLSTITSTSSWDGTGTIPPAYCPSAPSSGWCRVYAPIPLNDGWFADAVLGRLERCS
jgi:hypothetical protein